MYSKTLYTASWLLLAAALLAGCSADDNGVPSGEAQGMEMRFDIKSEGLLAGDTRATVINSTAELQTSGEDIEITAYYHETNRYMIGAAALRYNSSVGNWEFVDGSGNTIHYYWPIEGSKRGDITVSSLDFVGFWPKTGAIWSYVGYDLEVGTLMPKILVGAPGYCDPLPVTSEGQAGLTELMCAYISDKTYDDQVDEGGRLQMQFRHPFASVYFRLAPSCEGQVSITSITIPGIKNQGTYCFSSNAWTSSGDPTNLVITGTPATGDTPYIVMPQTLGSKTISVVVNWADWGVDLPHNMSTEIDLRTWEPGHSYTYTFTVTTSELKVSSTQFTEQW